MVVLLLQNSSSFKNSKTVLISCALALSENGFSGHYVNKVVAEFQKEHDLKVMVNDDCHQPLFLCDESTKEAYKFAEKLKIKLVDHF